MATRPRVDPIFDLLPDPAMILSSNGRVSCVNDAARDRFGAWIEGQSYISALRQPALLGPVEDAFHDRVSATARFVHAHSEIETAFDVLIRPLEANTAARDGALLLLFRDVTDTEGGAAMRRDFVANVSHELKTPLTALIGFVETLQGPARDDARARERFLGLMGQELARMDRLVADILSLSRVEAQLRQRPRERLDLVVVVGEALAILAPLVEDAGFSVTTDLPDAAIAAGDRDQLVQVVVNLVENAVKYGAGPVQVRLNRREREPVMRGPAWQLDVRDDGGGVPSVHLPRLTERFYRVDTGRSRSQGGTGLGLSIVKHIVNRHRGRLHIDSRVGQGTTVTILLPA